MIFPNPTNLTNVTQVLETADSFSGGILGIAIWLIVLFGSLLLTSSFNMKESLVASSFILMIISFFLKYLNMLSDFFLWISAIFFIVALIVSFTKAENPI